MCAAEARERLSYLLALPPDELVFHHLGAVAEEAPDLSSEITSAVAAWPAPWSDRPVGQPLPAWLRAQVAAVVDTYDRDNAADALPAFGDALQRCYDEAQALFRLNFDRPLVAVEVVEGNAASGEAPHSTPHITPHITIEGCDGHYFVTVAPPGHSGEGDRWLLHGDPCGDLAEITRALSGYAAFRVPPSLHELDERLEAGRWPVGVAREACVAVEPGAVIVALRRGDIRWQPETIASFARLLGMDDISFASIGATIEELWSVMEVQLERLEAMLVRGRSDPALAALPPSLAKRLWEATRTRWMKAHDQSASRVLIELGAAAQRDAFPSPNG